MANQEHLAVLKQGVDAWNDWRRRNPEVVPDLSGAALGRPEIKNVPVGVMQSFSWLTATRPDLTQVNLSNANMRGASLLHADLSRADLSGADLKDADLRAVTFFEANLTHASLNHASLRYAELNGANLCDADLMEADLGAADLDGANLTGAKLGYTMFGGNDLSKVKGLDRAVHAGPSAVSIDTVYESEGNIPESFMREAGVPEDFITYMRSLAAGGRMIRFYSCFISYSHADKVFARRLHDALQERGVRCWLDEHWMLPGQKIYDEIDRGIRLSDIVLLCCSKDSLTSWWVDNEIDIAFEKEQRLRKDRGEETPALIPLDLDGYLFGSGWKSGKATQVRSRLAADFVGWEQDERKFEGQIERLVRALEELQSRRGGARDG